MTIYVVSYRGHGIVEGEHGGYKYVSSKREADALKRACADKDQQHVESIDKIQVEISKRGILHVLNNRGGHPDNG